MHIFEQGCRLQICMGSDGQTHNLFFVVFVHGPRLFGCGSPVARLHISWINGMGEDLQPGQARNNVFKLHF